MHGIGQLVHEEVERHVDEKRLVVLAFDVERCRRQALANFSAWASSAAWPCSGRIERRAAVSVIAGFGDGPPSNMTVAVKTAFPRSRNPRP